MKKVLKHSIIILILISNVYFGQITPDEKLSLMQNSLIVGLEKKGVEIAIEIISLSEYNSVREKALFSLAEYYFYKGILKNIDETSELYNKSIEYINQSYTFYSKLLKEYPNGRFNNIVQQRVNYLEQNYKQSLLFSILNNNIQNERLLVERKLKFLNLFIKKKKENPFLFFTEGKFADTYAIVEKYLDDIIINDPSQAVYAYYYKLLNTLSRENDIDIFSEKIGAKSYSIEFINSNNMISKVVEILDSLTIKYPHHPLTIQSYLVAVSYLIQADMWEYNSPEVKKWLELALKNDKDNLGIRYLITKEYILKTKFTEE